MAGHIASSSNINWNTPEKVLSRVRDCFGGGVDLDPCSNSNSTVNARTSYTLPQDGLMLPWNIYDHTRIFINPPFGVTHLSKDYTSTITAKEHSELKKLAKTGNKDAIALLDYFSIKYDISDWMERCVKEAQNPSIEIITLTPVAVDTYYWQELIFKHGNAIAFPKGRIKFLNEGVEMKSPPMPTALTYFGTHVTHFEEAFNGIGKVIKL